MPSPHAATPERLESVLNPLAWAQVRLVGGPRRILGMLGLYTGAYVFFNIFIYRSLAPDVSLSAFAGGSLAFTLITGCILFVVVGAGFINRAILRDFNSDMITSHRSTAMTGRDIVIGYLTGPTITVLGFTVINWIACSILAKLAGYPFYMPSVAFICVSTLALMIWNISVLAGLSYKGKMSVAAIVSPLVLVVTIPPLAQAFAIHPGLALVLNYRLLNSVTLTSAAGLPAGEIEAIVISMLFQAVLSVVLFAAAARKFQRDDVSAFNMPLAYVLLGLVALISSVGLDRYPDIQIPFGSPGDITLSTMVLATLVSLLLVSLLPVTEGALESALWHKRKFRDPQYAGPRARPYWEAAFASSLIALGILTLVALNTTKVAADCRTDWSAARVAGYVALSFFLTLMTISGVMRCCYAYVRNGIWMLVIFLVLLWVMPILGDLLLEVATDRVVPEKSFLYTVSPIGSWVLLLTKQNGPFMWGLISQAGVAVGAQILAWKARY